MNKIRKPREHSLFLKGFRSYIQYVNSSLYFHKEHVVGLENVPVNGIPMVVVSNHQNCLNDPLCVCLKLTDRRMNFLAPLMYSIQTNGDSSSLTIIFHCLAVSNRSMEHSQLM